MIYKTEEDNFFFTIYLLHKYVILYKYGKESHKVYSIKSDYLETRSFL